MLSRMRSIRVEARGRPEAAAASMTLALAAGQVSEESLTRWVKDNWPKLFESANVHP
jgi:hypothetical protein